MKRMLICLFCLVISFTFSACSSYWNIYNSDIELLYFDEYNPPRYQYSGKVQIYDCYDSYDRLYLNESKNTNKKYLFDKRYIALEGNFDEVAWEDFKLFIHMGETYYVFDINTYNAPPYDENNNPTYELLEFSKEDFIKNYPDYDFYIWETYYSSSQNLDKRIELEHYFFTVLPESVKILEYKDTRDKRPQKGCCLKGTLEFCSDKESEEFIEMIKTEWIKPPISDSMYLSPLEIIAFNQNLIEYSDDYYYHYNQSSYYCINSEDYTESYYNIFAYDDESKRLYFCIENC